MSIRVALVDDHQLLRRGLRATLVEEYAMEVVAEAATLADAEATLRDTDADVVVVDVHLPDGSGLDLVRRLRENQPALGIVVLTMSSVEASLLQSLDAGASAFVRKDAPSEELVAAVGHAASTPTRFSATGLAAALAARSGDSAPRLTTRERQILDLLSEGLTAAAIGRRLFIGEATVKTHLGALYEKLEVHSRSQALMTALRLGLIHPRS